MARPLTQNENDIILSHARTGMVASKIAEALTEIGYPRSKAAVYSSSAYMEGRRLHEEGLASAEAGRAAAGQAFRSSIPSVVHPEFPGVRVPKLSIQAEWAA